MAFYSRTGRLSASGSGVSFECLNVLVSRFVAIIFECVNVHRFVSRFVAIVFECVNVHRFVSRFVAISFECLNVLELLRIPESSRELLGQLLRELLRAPESWPRPRYLGTTQRKQTLNIAGVF